MAGVYTVSLNNSLLNAQTTLPLCNESDAVTPNGTWNVSPNDTMRERSGYAKVLPYVMSVIYILICVCGLVGNGLVIYVVLMFAKMKTVTNMYILNLALSDMFLLVILPMMATTTLLEHWIFGFAMCKIYFVLYSINLFGGVFNLCVMSADRYLAVCHPIRSLKYRTPRISLFLCLCVWSLSFLVMLPIILYSRTQQHNKFKDKESCNIMWPEDQLIPPNKAFIWYSFILGFAVPVSLISVFYVLVILRLRHVGPAKKSKEKRKSHRRVTRLVLSVIAVYIFCWLPYWCFQLHLIFQDLQYMSHALIFVFNGFTVLSFANSMLNPFLYAFLSDNFRKSFVKAFKCLSRAEINKSICNENSIFPRTSHTFMKNGNFAEERIELSAVETTVPQSPPLPDESDEDDDEKLPTDELGFLKPPTQL